MAKNKHTSQNKSGGTSSAKSTRKTAETTKTAAERAVESTGGSWISTRAICSIVVLVLFALFLVICLKPDGALLRLLYLFLLGTIGKSALYISVPVLFGMFLILAFQRQRPVLLRSICLIAFVFVCGCLPDFLRKPIPLPEGIAAVGALYQGGIDGTTAGVLCGGMAALLRWLCGSVFSCVLLIVGGILLLLTAVDMPLPSIVRAIRNRPRPKTEKTNVPPVRREPAEVVVNHIANRQIKIAEERRQKKAERANIDIPLDDSPEPDTSGQGKRKRSRADELMDEIVSDPEAPVGASAKAFSMDIGEKPPESTRCDQSEEAQSMPPLVMRGDNAVEQPETEAAPEAESFGVAAEPAVRVPVKSVEVPAKITAKEAAESAAQVAQEIAHGASEIRPEYCYPPLDLLKLPAQGAVDGTEEMRENSRRLNETLESFKIEAHIINVTRGPSVTRYEVELEKGVRLNKLTTCADDIALSLGAAGVRIAAVPGKISVVGIEVPNRSVTTVSLREVIDSPDFRKAKSKSTFAVGKDIGGSCIVGNIAKLPHMLIAGTTGSGKSVCMNSIIISLLFKAGPEDVKLIMVDPKMVELGIYNGIPHLLIPVVTDPKKAAGSLQWAVTEMMRRYRAMSDAGVRDLESYNAIIDSQEVEGERLPQVVVIIDELADLMLVAAKEVEESICRIAQMGRAAGIHLIIATQRPSADVITGLMKANIPSRIAFAVASAMESRIILDTQGAEKLVGKGDMLYAPIGCGKPKRVQGCWVSEEEVEAVANYIKDHYHTDYDQQVIAEIEKKAEQTGTKASQSDPEPNVDDFGGDEMLPAAVDVILETGQASVSMLQRRLKLGYARAARIVDEMEDKGIVGPFMGSKPRAILITKEQWQAMRDGSAPQMSFEEMSRETESTPEDEE